MYLYISGSVDRESFNYDVIDQLDNSDVVLILPGGLGTFYDLFHAIKLRKKIILYNKEMYYAPIIKNLYDGYEKGYIKSSPHEYLEIESEKDKVKDKVEEIINGKVNNGETSKLL